MNAFAISVKFSEGVLNFQDADGREHRPRALLRRGLLERPVLDLSQIAQDGNRVEEVLHEFGISQDALKKIYLCLGGREVFLNRLEQREITIERAGFSKKGKREAKFYVVLNEAKDSGAFKTFFLGYSRQGTPRAINKVKEKEVALPVDPQEISRKDQENGHICRWMGWEPGIRIDELGGENLNQLHMRQLTEPERWTLYRSLIEGLALFAKNGWVHRDIKPDNIVVMRDPDGVILGIKFVDLDFLEKENSQAYWSGTRFYASLDLMKAYLEARVQPAEKSRRFRLDAKDDLWAAMWVIYKLEKRLPSEKRWINSEIMDRAEEYCTLWNEIPSSIEKPEKGATERRFRQFIQNIQGKFPEEGLFVGIEPKRPLDALMIALSVWNNTDRPTAAEVLEALAPETPVYNPEDELSHRTQIEDSIQSEATAPDKKEKPSGWRHTMAAIWSSFVAFWRRLCCCGSAAR